MLLTMNWRKEIRERFERLKALKENLISAEMELAELEEMYPVSSVPFDKVPGNGVNPSNPAIRFDERKGKLREQIREYKALINDSEKGIRILSKSERQILELRILHGKTQEECADILGCGVTTVKRYENAAYAKMETQIIKY